MVRTEESQTSDNDLFSLDVSNHGAKAFSRQRSLVPVLSSEHLEKLLNVIRDLTELETKLHRDVGRLKSPHGVASARDCASLARDLRALGYTIREHGPGTKNPCQKKGKFCLETLSHNYLTCQGSSTVCCQEELIVDPYFREEFQIANPPQSYTILLSLLPSEFVGTAEKMTFVVEAMSRAVAEAFNAQDMTLPPWRRANAALSKWGLEVRDDTVHGKQSKARKCTDAQESRKEELSAAGSKRQLQSKDLDEQGEQDTHEGDETSTSSNRLRPLRRVSLLARGLADFAAIQKAPLRVKPEVTARTDKLKRTFSWDFSGLQPITTVRRAGKAR